MLEKTDDFDRADVNVLVKAGALKPGTYAVRHKHNDGREYEIAVETDERVQLTFPDGESVTVGLVYTEVKWGKRPNFICPMCTKPRMQVYPQGGCRRCCGLGFKQKRNRIPTVESLETIEAIESALGWSLEFGCPKPAGVSQAKHEELVAKINRLMKIRHDAEAAAKLPPKIEYENGHPKISYPAVSTRIIDPPMPTGIIREEIVHSLGF